MIDILNKTIMKITGAEYGSKAIFFEFDDGSVAEMSHEQDCCEVVTVEEVIGDIKDIIRTPLLVFYENSNKNLEDEDGSSTWTFYEFRTIYGTVVIRWFGSSNGYYSESVDFFWSEKND